MGLVPSPLVGPLGLFALGPLRPECLVSLAIEMCAPPFDTGRSRAPTSAMAS